MDSEFLRQENDEVNKVYRPYFYEFFIDKTETKKTQNFLELNTFYTVRLHSDIDDMSPDSQSEVLKGELFYSASPPRQVKAFIEFLAKPNEEQLEKIKDLYQETIDAIKLNEDKEDIYNHFFEDIRHGYYPNKITVYNVGQGNSVKIQLASDKNEDSFAIVFDIGRSRRLGEGKIFDKNAEKAAKNLSNKSMFILSHWDLDHIQGVIYLRKEQFETTWIVPQLPSGASKSAERLAAYLSVIHNIKDVFISSCLNGKVIFNRNNFKLGKGHGKNSNRKVGEYRTRYNDKNNLGLVLSIRGRDNQKVLLPGDCEYIQLPCEFLQEYNLMIASHHGARTQINNIGFPTGKIKNKQTIFTVNRKDSYPNISHAVGLRRLGYKHSKSSDIGNKTFDI